MNEYFGKGRPGSQGEAVRKANLTFLICAFVVYLLIVLCLTTFEVYPKYFFERAPGFANSIGLLFIVISFLMVVASAGAILPSRQGHWYWILTLIFLVFGFAAACGFEFSLSGVPNID